jgi:hypothetical protein
MMSDMQMLQMEQSRRGRFGRMAMRGALPVGQMAGMAGLMGYGNAPGNDVFTGASDVANLGLMSRNPYAMAAAAVYKGNRWGSAMAQSVGGMGGDVLGSFGGFLGMRDTGYGRKVQGWMGIDPGSNNISDSGAKVFMAALRDAAKELDKLKSAASGVKQYYQGTWRGFEEAKRQDKLMSQYGFSGDVYSEGPEGAWGMPTLRRDMSPQDKVRMGLKLGEGGLKTLSGRVGSERALARAQIIKAMRASKFKGEITEEMVLEADTTGRYSKLKGFEAVVDRLIRVFQKGMRINVNTVSGMTPGQRVESNSTPPGDFAPGGRYGA